MDKELIKTKCRKVFIPLENNRIFASDIVGGEFQFVSVFRQESDAVRTVQARNHHYIYDSEEKKNVVRKVASFYLVPAKLID